MAWSGSAYAYLGLPPVYVTENGRACDGVVEDGAVRDPDRVRYLEDPVAEPILRPHFVPVARRSGPVKPPVCR